MIANQFWNNLGFRSRLTLCLSGVFCIILAIGYWSLFLEFQDELQNDFDRSLYNYATDLLQNVELNSGGGADLPYEVIFSADKIFPFPHGDTLVKIYQNDFSEIFTFATDKDAPKKLDAIHEKIRANADNQFFDLVSDSGNRWRGVLMQVDDVPVPKIYFFVGVPRNTLTLQENKFRSIFIAGQIIILLISSLMISVLAKSLLQSLESLTNKIRSMPINSSNFSFAVEKGPPEIALLSKILNSLLSQINRSLTAHQDFVAQAAHQLKTPLTIAKGHLEQLAHEAKNEASAPLTTALNEIDMMSSTISNLLNLVQIESGFQSLKETKFDILDKVISEIDTLDFLARKKGIKFQVHCEEYADQQFDWIIRSDSQLISIIFKNLLENAIKYSTHSPIEVRLKNAAKSVEVTISNPASPESDSEKRSTDLKEKFVRGSTPEPGQGLGLYIADKIAAILNIQLVINRTHALFTVKVVIPKP